MEWIPQQLRLSQLQEPNATAVLSRDHAGSPSERWLGATSVVSNRSPVPSALITKNHGHRSHKP